MSKEIGYHIKLVRDGEDFSQKTPEDRIAYARRLQSMYRIPPRGGYCEYRPRVTEEFEEEEARISAEKGILGDIMETNPVLRTFFWPWKDAIDDSKKAPPPPPEKGLLERVGEIWKKTKEYICVSRDKVCKAWTQTKEVVYCYWERGTSGWYFEVTPDEWSTPNLHSWPVAPTEVYWFPDVYFSNQPADYNGPFAIGAWPVCDPIPHIPYECEIKCAILRKWDKYKAWRKKCKQPPIEAGMEAEGKAGLELEVRGERGGLNEQQQANEDTNQSPKKIRYDCDGMCGER